MTIYRLIVAFDPEKLRANPPRKRKAATCEWRPFLVCFQKLPTGNFLVPYLITAVIFMVIVVLLAAGVILIAPTATLIAAGVVLVAAVPFPAAVQLVRF